MDRGTGPTERFAVRPGGQPATAPFAVRAGGVTVRPPTGPVARVDGTALARLATDPRPRWWARRVALAATAGTGMALLAGWPAGIAGAAVTAAADTVLRVRTSPVVPAPVRDGAAQRRTRRRLGRLAPSGYLAVHGRLVPGTSVVIDHLVAGPAGVFAMTSQRWDRRLPVRASHEGELFHGPYPQADRLRQVRWAAGQAGVLLGAALGEPVTVRPAMVIYGPPVPWAVMRLAGVDVFGGRRLRTYLRRELAASRGRRLTERQAELIHAAAARVLPPAR